MYFLDPDRGRRRRALIRDQAVGFCNYMACHWDKAARDFNNRLTGFFAEIERRGRGEPVSDNQLANRVRSKLGRHVSHPRAIDVEVHDGRVTLRGRVLASEAQGVFDAVRWVPGVRHVDNQMEAYSEPGNIAALQGGECRGETRGGAQSTWPPAVSLGATAGGLAMMLFGVPRMTSLVGLATGLGVAMSLASEPGGYRRRMRLQNREEQGASGRGEQSVEADERQQAQSRGPAAPPHEDRREDLVPTPQTTTAVASGPPISMSPPQPARFPAQAQRGVDS
jgi:hypothetical protein